MMMMRNRIVTAVLTSVVLLVLRVPAFSTDPVPHVCFRVIDANNDGHVDFNEFRKAFPDAEKRDFDEIDSDRDGTLCHDEYHDSLGHGNRESSELKAPEKM